MDKIYIWIIGWLILCVICFIIGVLKHNKACNDCNRVGGEYLAELFREDAYNQIDEIFKDLGAKIDLTYEEDSKKFIAIAYKEDKERTYFNKTLWGLVQDIREDLGGE